jgi:hypothetical protein
MFVDDYPSEIKQKYGPMSLRAARLRPYIATLLFIAIFVVPMVGLFRLHANIESVSFLSAFVFAGISLLGFNLFDLIILDWLFFCTLQPRSMVLPGTEGMAAYHDYRFHFIGFLKGLGFTAVGSLIIAGLWTVYTMARPVRLKDGRSENEHGFGRAKQKIRRPSIFIESAAQPGPPPDSRCVLGGLVDPGRRSSGE